MKKFASPPARWLAAGLIAWLSLSGLTLVADILLVNVLTLSGGWALLGAAAGFAAMFSALHAIITIHTAKSRRPDEPFRVWRTRAFIKQRQGHPYYIRLACDCQAQLYGDEPVTPGTLMWCSGHSWFGPARPTIVVDDGTTVYQSGHHDILDCYAD